MTRNESSFLVGSMIRANTSARSASSPPVAVSNPSTRYARDKATHRRAIRDDVIASGPPDASASRPKSNSSCPAATRSAAAAFNTASSASWCAEPMCSISRDPRCDQCTIRTAVAPDAVWTARTYGATPDSLKPSI